jgi:hypothetical protein
MNIKEILFQLQFGKISLFDALTTLLNLAQKDPEMLRVCIHEVQRFINQSRTELNQEVFNVLGQYFNGELNETDKKNDFVEHVIFMCSHYNYTKLDDVPELNDLNRDFFGLNERILEDLKRSLEKYITPHQITIQPNEKPKSKDVWGLVARYNFLDEWGVLSGLKNLSETEKAKAISQILGCNLHNAKKLKNGTYPTNETKDEQLERKQLINLIKRTQTD